MSFESSFMLYSLTERKTKKHIMITYGKRLYLAENCGNSKHTKWSYLAENCGNQKLYIR